MMLAGDIGGTKTMLAVYADRTQVPANPVHEIRFKSADYPSFETIVQEFLDQTGAKPQAACFGVAGPVKDRHSRITNLPWNIDADEIEQACGIPKISLINDLKAIAVSVPHLGKDSLSTLNPGIADPKGNKAVIAPGTGLGVAFLVWAGARYHAFASEGGHTAFSPRDAQDLKLLKFLTRRYGHVSFERVCSGSHLPCIYEYFLENKIFPEPAWLGEKLDAAMDKTRVIVETALENKADICEATLDMFVRALGAVTSNMAVTLLPTGGIYLGGGIPPRILKRLAQPDFLGRIADKGRFSSLCANMPVHVILDPQAALHGAAWYGFEKGLSGGQTRSVAHHLL
ncbi:glucokinase [Desulfobacter hydrogenophilus]|uniref:Glucokinase n=1 Tax=Desulfobacter hydrogenophilus TaxID=2291 RepID=A0A328FHP3_9BACT|nr:glucokinase [Desulfobacter hydrogenophilus]NDY70712.1 glucokinase [Desulfobacter hydrogenophilus]QBH12675.1 glucokinase [Desulfobacter hydrogenophilus]RAM03360.1 glucokinase [Desulfobacter hydrogenophilus]